MKFTPTKGKTPKNYPEQGMQQVETLEGHPEIRGYDFEKGLDFTTYLASLASTGFQATHLGQAIEIVKTMRREKATIFLSLTSNMMSSGLRDVVTFLVKHRYVDVLVMAAGAIEEDVLKSLKHFVVGTFEAPGWKLRENGVNRIGNVFVPNDRYLMFEEFITPFLSDCYAAQKKKKTIWNSKTIIEALGRKIDDDRSVLHWAAKNSIPTFCPGLTDGAFGDMIYFEKQRHPDFILDSAQDITDIVKICLNADKTGLIILGGGIAKHYTLNAQIFREGAEFAVYINTGAEFDGSDSGARVDEAISWGKIKPNALHVKVHADATLAFPLLVAATFGKEHHARKRNPLINK